MTRRSILLGLCIAMGLSACSMNNNFQKTDRATEPEVIKTEVSETETKQRVVPEQNADLLLLGQGNVVEICNGELIAQIQEPYSGVFWEDENYNEEVAGVYYVKFTNCTDFMIKTADIILGDNERELLFHIDMLKAGETVYVAESDRQAARSGEIRYIDSDIKYVESESIVSDSVTIELINDNKLIIRNLTGKFLPLLHIYYGPFDDSNIRISGAAFSVPVDGMEPNQEIEVSVDKWSSLFKVTDVISISE